MEMKMDNDNISNTDSVSETAEDVSQSASKPNLVGVLNEELNRAEKNRHENAVATKEASCQVTIECISNTKDSFNSLKRQLISKEVSRQLLLKKVARLTATLNSTKKKHTTDMKDKMESLQSLAAEIASHQIKLKLIKDEHKAEMDAQERIIQLLSKKRATGSDQVVFRSAENENKTDTLLNKIGSYTKQLKSANDNYKKWMTTTKHSYETLYQEISRVVAVMNSFTSPALAPIHYQHKTILVKNKKYLNMLLNKTSSFEVALEGAQQLEFNRAPQVVVVENQIMADNGAIKRSYNTSLEELSSDEVASDDANVRHFAALPIVKKKQILDINAKKVSLQTLLKKIDKQKVQLKSVTNHLKVVQMENTRSKVSLEKTRNDHKVALDASNNQLEIVLAMIKDKRKTEMKDNSQQTGLEEVSSQKLALEEIKIQHMIGLEAALDQRASEEDATNGSSNTGDSHQLVLQEFFKSKASVASSLKKQKADTNQELTLVGDPSMLNAAAPTWLIESNPEDAIVTVPDLYNPRSQSGGAKTIQRSNRRARRTVKWPRSKGLNIRTRTTSSWNPGSQCLSDPEVLDPIVKFDLEHLKVLKRPAEELAITNPTSPSASKLSRTRSSEGEERSAEDTPDPVNVFSSMYRSESSPVTNEVDFIFEINDKL